MSDFTDAWFEQAPSTVRVLVQRLFMTDLELWVAGSSCLRVVLKAEWKNNDVDIFFYHTHNTFLQDELAELSGFSREYSAEGPYIDHDFRVDPYVDTCGNKVQFIYSQVSLPLEDVIRICFDFTGCMTRFNQTSFVQIETDLPDTHMGIVRPNKYTLDARVAKYKRRGFTHFTKVHEFIEWRYPEGTREVIHEFPSSYMPLSRFKNSPRKQSKRKYQLLLRSGKYIVHEYFPSWQIDLLVLFLYNEVFPLDIIHYLRQFIL